MFCDNCGAEVDQAMVVDIDAGDHRQELWCMDCIRQLDRIAKVRGDVLGKHITTDEEARENGWYE